MVTVYKSINYMYTECMAWIVHDPYYEPFLQMYSIQLLHVSFIGRVILLCISFMYITLLPFKMKSLELLS